MTDARNHTELARTYANIITETERQLDYLMGDLKDELKGEKP